MPHVQVGYVRDVQIERTKRVEEVRELPNLGSTHIITHPVIGHRLGDIVVTVDIEALVKLKGWKALRSKSHKSKLADGAIQLQAINIRDVIP